MTVNSSTPRAFVIRSHSIFPFFPTTLKPLKILHRRRPYTKSNFIPVAGGVRQFITRSVSRAFFLIRSQDKQLRICEPKLKIN